MDRRVIAATSFALAVAFAPTARAQDKLPADWKWDARTWASAQSKEKALKVGDRHYHEGNDKDTKKQKVVAGGNTQNEESASELTFRYIEEILEVDGDGKATKAKLTMEKWSKKTTGTEAKEDKSLEGKTVMLSREGDKTNSEIKEADGVSDDAKAWVNSELSLTKAFAGAMGSGDDKEMEMLLPEGPIAPDGEWKIDAQKVATKLFGDDMKIDTDKSSAGGKLTECRMDKAGYPRGKWVVELKLQLKTIPNTQAAWTEGGAFVIRIEYEGSLENNRHYRTMQMAMDFGGKGEIAQEDAKATLEMKITAAKKEASGRVDK